MTKEPLGKNQAMKLMLQSLSLTRWQTFKKLLARIYPAGTSDANQNGNLKSGGGVNSATRPV